MRRVFQNLKSRDPSQQKNLSPRRKESQIASLKRKERSRQKPRQRSPK